MPPKNDSQFSMRYNKFGQNYPVKNHGTNMDLNDTQTDEHDSIIGPKKEKVNLSAPKFEIETLKRIGFARDR
jgi:hypothetical protein